MLNASGEGAQYRRNDCSISAVMVRNLTRNTQLPFTKRQKAALEGQIEMTYDLFWECLQVCFEAGNMERYFEIWYGHPQYIAELMQRSEEEPYRSKNEARWQKLKKKLTDELGEEWVAEHCKD